MDNILSFFSYDPSQSFLFTNISFWIFFALVLGGFTLCYRHLRTRNIFLFLCSLFFYYKTGGEFIFLLLFSILLNYLGGILIAKAGSIFAKIWLIFTVSSNLLLLAYYKYSYFIIDILNQCLGTSFLAHDYIADISNRCIGSSFSIEQILLPVGISFFTFQGISYIVDVYRKQSAALYRITDLGFYISFFPQLVAGPIVRASDFIPQLRQYYQLSSREFSTAVFLILCGLFKKIVISDYLGFHFVDRFFDQPALYTSVEAWIGVYAYAVQIYCDFSGYTDIAIGAAALLGFHLPINFNSPYKAVSITDFWRRWHISLSSWLKDYVYIPLGGNRHGKSRTLIHLFITMLIGGIWHGAMFNFLLWGAIHGLLLSIEKLSSFIFSNKAKLPKKQEKTIGPIAENELLENLSVSDFLIQEKGSKLATWKRFFSIFLTFHLICFSWLLFRVNELNEIPTIIQRLFSQAPWHQFSDILKTHSLGISLILFSLIVHWLPESVKEGFKNIFIKTPLALKLLIILIFAFILYQFSNAEMRNFIYFQF